MRSQFLFTEIGQYLLTCGLIGLSKNHVNAIMSKPLDKEITVFIIACADMP